MQSYQYETHGAFRSLNLEKNTVEAAEIQIVTKWIILFWVHSKYSRGNEIKIHFARPRTPGVRDDHLF